MHTMYNPKRIERTIKRFENDQATMSAATAKNLKEMGELANKVDQANTRIAELRTENKRLEKEFAKVKGKIGGLQMVLEDTTDPES